MSHVTDEEHDTRTASPRVGSASGQAVVIVAVFAAVGVLAGVLWEWLWTHSARALRLEEVQARALANALRGHMPAELMQQTERPSHGAQVCTIEGRKEEGEGRKGASQLNTFLDDEWRADTPEAITALLRLKREARRRQKSSSRLMAPSIEFPFPGVMKKDEG